MAEADLAGIRLSTESDGRECMSRLNRLLGYCLAIAAGEVLESVMALQERPYSLLVT